MISPTSTALVPPDRDDPDLICDGCGCSVPQGLAMILDWRMGEPDRLVCSVDCGIAAGLVCEHGRPADDCEECQDLTGRCGSCLFAVGVSGDQAGRVWCRATGQQVPEDHPVDSCPYHEVAYGRNMGGDDAHSDGR
jgi:hypothetical protein